MDVFQIEGPVRLSGRVEVNGSKNASLPIMAATLLAPGRSTLIGVPRLADINVFRELIDQLGCEVERQDDGLLAIDVIDTGVGIDPAHLDRIFDPFRSDFGEGTGLGLPLCRRILVAHNGSIGIESTPGQGTAVHFEFPLGHAHAAHTPH